MAAAAAVATVSRCQVAQCSTPCTHQTSSHVCETCGCDGHGRHEHGKPEILSYLSVRVSLYDTAPFDAKEGCTMHQCAYPTTHQTSAHACGICRGNHARSQCPNGTNGTMPPDAKAYEPYNRCGYLLEPRWLKEAVDALGTTTGKVWTQVWLGMGHVRTFTRASLLEPVSMVSNKTPLKDWTFVTNPKFPKF